MLASILTEQQGAISALLSPIARESKESVPVLVGREPTLRLETSQAVEAPVVTVAPRNALPPAVAAVLVPGAVLEVEVVEVPGNPPALGVSIKGEALDAKLPDDVQAGDVLKVLVLPKGQAQSEAFASQSETASKSSVVELKILSTSAEVNASQELESLPDDAITKFLTAAVELDILKQALRAKPLPFDTKALFVLLPASEAIEDEHAELLKTLLRTLAGGVEREPEALTKLLSVVAAAPKLLSELLPPEEDTSDAAPSTLEQKVLHSLIKDIKNLEREVRVLNTKIEAPVREGISSLLSLISKRGVTEDSRGFDDFVNLVGTQLAVLGQDEEEFRELVREHPEHIDLAEIEKILFRPRKASSMDGAAAEQLSPEAARERAQAEKAFQQLLGGLRESFKAAKESANPEQEIPRFLERAIREISRRFETTPLVRAENSVAGTSITAESAEAPSVSAGPVTFEEGAAVRELLKAFTKAVRGAAAELQASEPGQAGTTFTPSQAATAQQLTTQSATPTASVARPSSADPGAATAPAAKAVQLEALKRFLDDIRKSTLETELRQIKAIRELSDKLRLLLEDQKAVAPEGRRSIAADLREAGRSFKLETEARQPAAEQRNAEQEARRIALETARLLGQSTRKPEAGRDTASQTQEGKPYFPAFAALRDRALELVTAESSLLQDIAKTGQAAAVSAEAELAPAETGDIAPSAARLIEQLKELGTKSLERQFRNFARQQLETIRQNEPHIDSVLETVEKDDVAALLLKTVENLERALDDGEGAPSQLEERNREFLESARSRLQNLAKSEPTAKELEETLKAILKDLRTLEDSRALAGQGSSSPRTDAHNQLPRLYSRLLQVFELQLRTLLDAPSSRSLSQDAAQDTEIIKQELEVFLNHLKELSTKTVERQLRDVSRRQLATLRLNEQRVQNVLDTAGGDDVAALLLPTLGNMQRLLEGRDNAVTREERRQLDFLDNARREVEKLVDSKPLPEQIEDSLKRLLKQVSNMETKIPDRGPARATAAAPEQELPRAYTRLLTVLELQLRTLVDAPALPPAVHVETRAEEAIREEVADFLDQVQTAQTELAPAVKAASEIQNQSKVLEEALKRYEQAAPSTSPEQKPEAHNALREAVSAALTILENLDSQPRIPLEALGKQQRALLTTLFAQLITQLRTYDETLFPGGPGFQPRLLSGDALVDLLARPELIFSEHGREPPGNAGDAGAARDMRGASEAFLDYQWGEEVDELLRLSRQLKAPADQAKLSAFNKLKEELHAFEQQIVDERSTGAGPKLREVFDRALENIRRQIDALQPTSSGPTSGGASQGPQATPNPGQQDYPPVPRGESIVEALEQIKNLRASTVLPPLEPGVGLKPGGELTLNPALPRENGLPQLMELLRRAETQLFEKVAGEKMSSEKSAGHPERSIDVLRSLLKNGAGELKPQGDNDAASFARDARSQIEQRLGELRQAERPIAAAQSEALKAFGNIVRGQEVLSQLNPVMQALGEPMVMLFPSIVQGMLTRLELIFYPTAQNPGREQESGEEEGAEEESGGGKHGGRPDTDNPSQFSRVCFALELPFLGPLEVEFAHTLREAMITLTCESEETHAAILENMGELESILRDLGYETISCRAKQSPVESYRPEWLRSLSDGGRRIA